MSSNRGAAPGERRGGRKKGVPNKATIARQEAVAASGLTPLDFLLSTMRDGTQELGARLDAAKAAAQYVHPKLQPVDGKTGKSEIVVVGRIELVDLDASSGADSASA